MDNGQSDITNDFMLFIGYFVLYFMVFPDISKTVHWINITLGTVGKSDTMNDFVVFEVILTYMSLFSHFICCFGGGRVVRWCWVNFQCRGVLLF